MGLILSEMAMSRKKASDKCSSFAVPFMEHWLKVYLASLPEASQSDRQTIPHWLSELEFKWANPIANIILGNGNKPLSLNYYVNLFLTPYDPYGMFYNFAKGDSFPSGLAKIAKANGGKALKDAAAAYESFVAKAKEALKGKPNVDWPELTIEAFKQVLPKGEPDDASDDGAEGKPEGKPNPRQSPKSENSSLNEGGHAFGGLDANEIVWDYIEDHEEEIVAQNEREMAEQEYEEFFSGADWGDEDDIAERYGDWVEYWHLQDADELNSLPLPKSEAECRERIAQNVHYDIHQDEGVFDRYADDALSVYDDLYERAVDDFDGRLFKLVHEEDAPLRKVYPNVGFSYSMESSRSWSAGRWPSVYFTISITPLDDEDEDWDGDEFTVRVSDGHPNGQGADDYEIEWQGYRGNEDALWKGFVEEFVNWLDEELDDMHNNDDAYGLLAENLDEHVDSSASEGKLNESRELSKGVFWIKDPENPTDELTFPIPSGLGGETLDSSSVIAPGMANSGLTYNHSRIWRELPHSLTDGKPFDYYPRGRVEIRNGEAKIFANPLLGSDACLRVVKNAFGLNGTGLKSVEFVADGSEHYKSHFDSGYANTNGKGKVKGRKHGRK